MFTGIPYLSTLSTILEKYLAFSYVVKLHGRHGIALVVVTSSRSLDYHHGISFR